MPLDVKAVRQEGLGLAGSAGRLLPCGPGVARAPTDYCNRARMELSCSLRRRAVQEAVDIAGALIAVKTTKIVESLSALSGLGGDLARSAVALLEAEVDQLRFDLARNWRRFLGLVLLAALLFGIVFWTLGALLFAAGAGLASALPVWAAALVVAAGLLVLALILLWILRVRARRLESPMATVRRRVGSHLAFWQDVLGQAARTGDTGSGSEPDDPSGGGTGGGAGGRLGGES